MLKEIWYVRGARMGVNYGIDRLRFPAPLRVGERAHLARAQAVSGGQEVALDLALDPGGAPKPASQRSSIDF